MKKTIILIMLVAVALPLAAQHDRPHHEKKHKDITELVSDLSSSQKRKIESISKESKEKVNALRASQKAVRDSIAMYMDRDGDQSAVLYPLFEREATLQAAINREMYKGKIHIDQVLTKEQRTDVRNAAKNKTRKAK
jgi:hypothetical protein